MMQEEVTEMIWVQTLTSEQRQSVVRQQTAGLVQQEVPPWTPVLPLDKRYALWLSGRDFHCEIKLSVCEGVCVCVSGCAKQKVCSESWL